MLPRILSKVTSEVGGCLSRARGQGCPSGFIRLVVLRYRFWDAGVSFCGLQLPAESLLLTVAKAGRAEIQE
jgi:hypothetical protein